MRDRCTRHQSTATGIEYLRHNTSSSASASNVHHPRKTHGQPLHTVSPYSFCLSYICEALTFRYRGRYPADDDNEDEPLSEDDAWEFPTPVQDDNEGWESVPRPHLNVANRNNDSVVGNEQEKAPFYATPKDIAFVRSAFPLPPELVTQILDLAEYWVYSQKTLSEPNVYRDANARYLRSGPIRGGEFTYPLRRVVITTDSRDQGWSSYRETQGTREGSWTWFELTLDDGKSEDEIVRVEVVRNIHAGIRFEKHRAVIEDERVLKQAKRGDRLSVWVRAMFPGWCNHVRSVQIEAWSAC